MFGKALVSVGGLLVSLGVNATTTNFDFSGVEPNGASIDKTTIFELPTQTTGFNFVGALDAVGSIQNNQNPGATFGLYLGDTLVKDISFFNVDTTNNIYSFNFLNLSAGDYSFRFNINGNASARAYTFTSTITPVPEPENFSLMMLGIGMIGLLARRKAV
jgi:hypothetical protein